MTKDEMAKIMQETFHECEMLRGAGQAEYAGGEDAFGNFNRLASQLATTREKVLWTYIAKHFDGILAHINGQVSQREDVTGRINDAIVYLCLLRGMVVEDRRKNSKVNSLEQAMRDAQMQQAQGMQSLNPVGYNLGSGR